MSVDSFYALGFLAPADSFAPHGFLISIDSFYALGFLRTSDSFMTSGFLFVFY